MKPGTYDATITAISYPGINGKLTMLMRTQDEARREFEHTIEMIQSYMEPDEEPVRAPEPHEAPSFGQCCEDPRPRIGEKSGRVFCATCRRYLDAGGPAQGRPQDHASGPQTDDAGIDPPHQEPHSSGVRDAKEGDRT